MIGREWSSFEEYDAQELYVQEFAEMALPDEERIKETQDPDDLLDSFIELANTPAPEPHAKRLKSNIDSTDVKIIQTRSLSGYSSFDKTSGIEAVRIMRVHFAGHGLHIMKNDSSLICYTLGGAGDVSVEGSTVHSRKYDCICTDCRKKPQFRSNPGEPWDCAVVRIDGNFRSEMYPELCNDIKLNPFVLLTFGAGTRFRSVVWELLGLRLENSLNSEKLYNSHLMELFLELDSAILLTPRKKGGVPDIIEAIQNYLDNNYAGAITLDALAKKFNISKYHMSREFKKSIGKSPIDYLIDVRLNRAKTLLYDTDRSVSDISQLVGIQNPSHFLYLFKTREGITPSAFRKFKS